MKITHVIFSTSERFSVFWNLQAQVWKNHLNIEPVCLFLGDSSNVDLSEEHGKVIEVPVDPSKPYLIQITWSKFYFASIEPGTTLIGDIDLLPLSRRWFIDEVSRIPEDNYAHLDADGITQLNGTEYTWANKQLHAGNLIDKGCGTNVPGHYHCANGKTFRIGLEMRDSFKEEIDYIVNSGSYSNTRGYRECDPIDQENMWCAEELRSTRAIRRSILSKKINFTGLSLRNGLSCVNGDRLDKAGYIAEGEKSRYNHDFDRLKNGLYVDVHCARPFDHVTPDEREHRWGALERLLQESWNDPTLKH